MIKLYHSPRTRSTRICWLLEELGLPYELEVIPFAQENLKSAEYLKVHPLGKVPALEDGGIVMFESGAILEFLLEKYGGARLAPPAGTPERAAFLQWAHFGEATALPPLSDLAQHTLFKPEAERIPAVAADARVRVGAVLDTLERALAGRSYLVGESFTGADIMVGYALLLAKWFGLIGDARPNVTSYLERLEARPALQKALG